MDRVRAPHTITRESVWIDRERFDRANDHERARHDGFQETGTDELSLIGRPDIDTAVRDALGHAVVADHGFRGDSTGEPGPLARRPDIDAAMLDALRHAIVPGPRFPDG